jgi:hypothetical protein
MHRLFAKRGRGVPVKKFSDFAKDENGLEGEKIKLVSILNGYWVQDKEQSICEIQL